MFKAPYFKADGKKGRARKLPETLFDGVINDSVMHQVVKVYLANQRQGTASAKSRGEVAGGNSKPWKQKGTGRARAGSTRSPLWPGGGIAFPPRPHSWRQQVPKKVRSLARSSALNDRAQNEKVVIADMPKADKPKTKDLLAFLKAVGAEGKVLVLTDGKNAQVHLSGRNAPSVSVLPFGEESVYDVLWAETVVIERSALERGDGADAEGGSDE
ncbi:MAG: 50S ribosomal protein L4 [Longimicrobiales bacterium]